MDFKLQTSDKKRKAIHCIFTYKFSTEDPLATDITVGSFVLSEFLNNTVWKVIMEMVSVLKDRAFTNAGVTSEHCSYILVYFL